ncbi:non-ribosomal peptide synthetase [Wocania ichthyoenteri]|uniref:non-ribosomal peptide synthetase n=1 Tax=Wocania ichthyoenteri TaxID=1230531 RepID=UPI00053D9E88|nr:non-ribosomal peptide synthetase [Wocania ichthyoenteri]
MEKDFKKASILDRWKKKSKKANDSFEIVKAPDNNGFYNLSKSQKRLWFLQQLYPKNTFYNLSQCYKFEGNINIEILKKSLILIFEKHEILKSYYPTKKGKSVLKFNNSYTLNIKEKDFSNYLENEAESKSKTFIDKQANFNFNLASGPLIKASVLKITQNKYVLFITLHHIISDQWSMNILKQELANNYRALINNLQIKTDLNSISFKDYAYWQNQKQTYESQKIYWKNKLAGEIPFLNLPTDFTRPISPSFKGKTHTINFSKSISTDILDVAKKLEITPFTLFLSAYYILLQKFSNQEDILIGSPVSNRDIESLESVFGLFIDTVVFRTLVKKSLSIAQFIKEVNAMSMKALSNKDIPFDTLVKELNIQRSLAVNPLFQVMFVYASKPELPSFGNNLKLVNSFEYSPNVSKFDLTLFITENKGELSSTFEYATDLFEEETINRFQQHLKHILEYIVYHSNKTIDSIPALIEADEKLLVLNNVAHKNVFKGFESIHSIIEDVALKCPNNLAVTFGDNSISYKKLNEKSNRIAQEVLKKSTKNEVVGLCIERSLDMIIGMLGILKAGCAYLPIDPEYPNQRINFILNDAKVNIIISQSSLSTLFEEIDINSILIDEIDKSQSNDIIQLPLVKETDLAYIIYTSGTTGKPKGVPITHKNIINSTASRLDFYNENPSAFLLMSSISFDSSKAGVFWTLCTGGNLVISEKRIEQDIEKIANIVQQHNVSHTLMLPSLYNIILENVETKKLESLTTAIVAGEACSKSVCNIHFKTLPNVSLYNEYGPTEASVWCIAHKIETADLNKIQIPIGKPVANAQVYLLDDNKNKVPFGTSGEIYIGGYGLSKGYLNRPELTNKVFIENPFNIKEKLYKTGDLAKYRNDGAIEFLGRLDQQIKIRGYRVELDDIESTINKSDLVEQSVVIVKQDEGKPKQLIAYVKPDGLFDENQLKLQLKEALPDYMIPSNFVLIEEIPLLPNGKIDKKSLSSIKVISKAKDTNQIIKPNNDIEQKLLDIWEDILNIKSLSITDNFFEIGGDSILSIQIIAKARKSGLVIAPNLLFEHQTISELAMFVSLENETSIVEEAMVLGEVSLTPIQEWFFETHKTAPQYWNQIFRIKDLPKAFNKNILHETTNYIIKTHDALRSSFYLNENKWKAKVLSPDKIEAFIVVNISNVDLANYNSKTETILKDIQENKTLEEGNLFKCIYFETGDVSKNFIIFLSHHLIIDFVSWQIILNAYTEVIHNNKFTNRNTKTASFKTWSNHLLELSNSKNIKNEIDFWNDQITTKTVLPKDFKGDFPILEKDISDIYFEVDKTVTNNLINKANNIYNTKIDELLLTALVDTLSHWTNNKNVSLALERHGRETINTAIDLSNTVGWFTAFFPKTFNFESTTDIASKIIATKEQMREIPNGGMSYGILRYLTSSLGQAEYPEIVFNFLGKQTTGENNIEFQSKNTRHPFSERHYYLEINALIKDGVLGINCIYSSQVHKTETIKAFIDNFNESLKSIVAHCINAETVKYTPSDFEDVDLDQEDLDNLLNDLEL